MPEADRWPIRAPVLEPPIPFPGLEGVVLRRRCRLRNGGELLHPTPSPPPPIPVLYGGSLGWKQRRFSPGSQRLLFQNWSPPGPAVRSRGLWSEEGRRFLRRTTIAGKWENTVL